MNDLDMLRIAKQTRRDCALRVPYEFQEFVQSVRIELSKRLLCAAGKASARKRSIRLSLWIFTHPGNAGRAAEALDDVVRHEIAHLLTPSEGHGPTWWRCYRHLGGRSENRFHNLVVPKPRGGIWCPGCARRVAACDPRRAVWLSLQVVSECCELPCQANPPTPTQLPLFPLSTVGGDIEGGGAR